MHYARDASLFAPWPGASQIALHPERKLLRCSTTNIQFASLCTVLQAISTVEAKDFQEQPTCSLHFPHPQLSSYTEIVRDPTKLPTIVAVNTPCGG